MRFSFSFRRALRKIWQTLAALECGIVWSTHPLTFFFIFFSFSRRNMSSKKVTKTKDGLERKENGASPAPVASTSNLKNKGNLNMINLFVNLMEMPFFFYSFNSHFEKEISPTTTAYGNWWRSFWFSLGLVWKNICQHLKTACFAFFEFDFLLLRVVVVRSRRKRIGGGKCQWRCR